MSVIFSTKKVYIFQSHLLLPTQCRRHRWAKMIQWFTPKYISRKYLAIILQVVTLNKWDIRWDKKTLWFVWCWSLYMYIRMYNKTIISQKSNNFKWKLLNLHFYTLFNVTINYESLMLLLDIILLGWLLIWYGVLNTKLCTFSSE